MPSNEDKTMKLHQSTILGKNLESNATSELTANNTSKWNEKKRNLKKTTSKLEKNMKNEKFTRKCCGGHGDGRHHVDCVNHIRFDTF